MEEEGVLEYLPDRIVASSWALCAPSTDIEEAGPMPTLAFEDDFTS